MSAGKAVAGRAFEDAREFAELDRELRRADHAHLAVRDLEIVLGRLEHMARELLGLVGDRSGGQQHGRTGGDGLAAGEGAEPERHAAGIARDDGDVLHAQAELAGANLRERGAQALSDRGGAGEHRHASGVGDPHQSGLERTAAGALDAMRQPDADIAALASRCGLPAGEILPAGRPQDLRLAGGIVAAIVLHAGAGARLERLGVGHLLRRDQIATAHLGALKMQFARDAVHQPFHGEGRLRIAGAAHRRHRRLVGGGDRDVDGQGRKQIGPAHHGGRVVGNVHVLQRVGAEIVDQPAADAEELGIGVRPRCRSTNTGRAPGRRW